MKALVRRLAILIAAAAFTAGLSQTWARPAIPDFWNARERLPKPDLSLLSRLRFLTTTDFPPFNFVDSTGRLTGFNVDLARAICAELAIREQCQIEAVPWDDLEKTLADGGGEAIVAGLAITSDTRGKYVFTRSYLQFPARFVTLKDKTVDEPVYAGLAGKRVGVIGGSAHERMLRDLFPETRTVTYSRGKWLFDDLRAGKIDAVFGDGMRLGFWLSGTASQGCCAFAGGPYLAPEYLGQGLAIAVPRDKPDLARALDYALQELGVKGTFAELYLRYFPVSFY